MPPDYPRSAPAAVPPPSTARQLGLLLLRITAGTSLLFWYGGREALSAWSHLWQKTPWALPGQLATLGFPLAWAVATFLVLLVLIGSSFIILGLLTRLSALALGLTAGVTALLFTAHPAVEEHALLYAGLCFAISLCGPGLFALDRLLQTTGRRH